MKQDKSSIAEQRQRVLLVAHTFDAGFSMESRLSWYRATNAAKHYDVTVLCADPYEEVRCDVDVNVPGLQVVTVPHSAFEKLLINSPVGFYLAYRLWHRRVSKVARQLHARHPFALVHQVSYCGYREPGYCWKLRIPFVWGPIGGTQNVPARFLSQFSLLGAAKEACRSVANAIQLRFGRRVGQALRAASKVFVANREIQASFRRVRGVELPCQLETGIDQITDEPRDLRDSQQPLRVLWAGRLEDWKALPLLLKAVSQLPDDLLLELRILGSGSQASRLKGLAGRLGIEARLDWVPLPDCGNRIEHYQWADLFTFTSLRDTSGTGLLESLAAGIPIIGLDHQGARDIMTLDCAVPIRVESPQQVITDIGKALLRLAGDAHLLQKLSDGALLRAQKFHWQRLDTEMTEVYAELLQAADSKRPVKSTSRQVNNPRQATHVAG